MSALTADRNTPFKDGESLAVPVAANAVIFAGALVVANASGFAAPGSTATTLTYLGRAESAVNNTGGANGDKALVVRREKAFKWANLAGDPVVQADLGKTCYIVDDQTVAKTSATDTRSIAGKVVQVDADGVWVE
ncbi:hypothetical protein [Propionivibrio sp.]|uniref:hypothetical protein n=1 Tax=Propionivibrio sp. TaxID=2212460 RepID=UPI003BEFE80B